MRELLRAEMVSFQAIKTWKGSRDPDYAVQKARIEHLYAIADGQVIPDDGEPSAIFCVDEFGPLNLQPRSDKQWTDVGGKNKDPERGMIRRYIAWRNRHTNDERLRRIVNKANVA
ncbi:hypothetical protein ACIBP6_03290 [Nonomuraea terrae]|uniref:hypothetical protein n=1 Tax=Nonomuraea terrae TaxID=2530383 RepID=UPI0037AFC3C5